MKAKYVDIKISSINDIVKHKKERRKKNQRKLPGHIISLSPQLGVVSERRNRGERKTPIQYADEKCSKINMSTNEDSLFASASKSVRVNINDSR